MFQPCVVRGKLAWHLQNWRESWWTRTSESLKFRHARRSCDTPLTPVSHECMLRLSFLQPRRLTSVTCTGHVTTHRNCWQLSAWKGPTCRAKDSIAALASSKEKKTTKFSHSVWLWTSDLQHYIVCPTDRELTFTRMAFIALGNLITANVLLICFDFERRNFGNIVARLFLLPAVRAKSINWVSVGVQALLWTTTHKRSTPCLRTLLFLKRDGKVLRRAHLTRSDCVVIDKEDSVAPNAKKDARRLFREALLGRDLLEVHSGQTVAFASTVWNWWTSFWRTWTRLSCQNSTPSWSRFRKRKVQDVCASWTSLSRNAKPSLVFLEDTSFWCQSSSVQLDFSIHWTSPQLVLEWWRLQWCISGVADFVATSGGRSTPKNDAITQLQARVILAAKARGVQAIGGAVCEIDGLFAGREHVRSRMSDGIWWEGSLDWRPGLRLSARVLGQWRGTLLGKGNVGFNQRIIKGKALMARMRSWLQGEREKILDEKLFRHIHDHELFKRAPKYGVSHALC